MVRIGGCDSAAARSSRVRAGVVGGGGVGQPGGIGTAGRHSQGTSPRAGGPGALQPGPEHLPPINLAASRAPGLFEFREPRDLGLDHLRKAFRQPGGGPVAESVSG